MNSPTPDQNPSVPFFARFLESQDAEPRAAATLKYPSDRDEWWGVNEQATSESDTNAGGNRAAAMTLKYPSDRDEIDLH